MREPVELEWSECTYGGRRPWFLCPDCRERVALLYLGDGHFRCRHCLRLVYESQRERAGEGWQRHRRSGGGWAAART